MGNFEKTDGHKIIASIREAKEARETGDKKKEVNAWIEITKYTLKDEFGVENLTAIEGVRLRMIIEKVVEEEQEMVDRRDTAKKEGRDHDAKITDNNIFLIDVEAMHRWLYELYSIDLIQLQTKRHDEVFKEYLRRLRERSHNL